MPNGTSVDGNWVNDQLEGKSKISYGNGDTYIGEVS